MYDRLFSLNKKFILVNYLNLLDKFKLLRFNYKFAMYKQGLQKLKLSQINALKRSSSNIPTRKGCRSAYNAKLRQFLNIFYSKLAKLDLRHLHNKFLFNSKIRTFPFITTFIFNNINKISSIIDAQIKSVKVLEKKRKIIETKNINYNYKYFLEFLALNKVQYHYQQKCSKKPTIKSTLNSIIHKLALKGVTKRRIRLYMHKKYVYLLLKNHVANKYGAGSLSKLKLFYAMQFPNSSKQLGLMSLVYRTKLLKNKIWLNSSIRNFKYRQLNLANKKIAPWKKKRLMRLYQYNKEDGLKLLNDHMEARLIRSGSNLRKLKQKGIFSLVSIKKKSYSILKKKKQN